MDYREKEPCFRQITIRGVVQGIGFRPFVLCLAQELGLYGTVRNQGGAVLILAGGEAAAMEQFVKRLKERPPAGAWIADMQAIEAAPFAVDGFSIAQSGEALSVGNDFISPDIAVCNDCLREIRGKANRRYAHPFNSCAACGPRLSILERLPYDRENTAMKVFPLCEDCAAEYACASDRRCHAQTVSCKNCGPVLKLHLKSGGEFTDENALTHAIAALKAGKILAVKGIGGYHFACSPHRSAAIQALRALKGRDKKPFAVMLRDMEAIRKICHVNEQEERLLTCPARPITLLTLKQPVFAEEVLCGDSRCGCFLPYTALHALLLAELESLVLTSANPNGCGIFITDEEMRAFYHESPQLAGILYHDREILRAVEDSVAQVSAGKTQLLRRSRGYAPAEIPLQNRSGKDFLAFGGDLKASFCLVKNHFAYQSPYFGDLEQKSVYERFRASMPEYAALLHIQPAFILCDLHPAYFSSALAREWHLPVLGVQHHHAHIASVMAEHELQGKVLGVAFDGTGYGEDSAIWGGEFLVCEGADCRRAGHLAYTKLLGGDSGARDAVKTAFSYLWHSGIPNLEQFSEHAALFEAALAGNINTAESSSMGRLFDAVAAILKLGAVNSYEGECAILLQRCAEKALQAGVKAFPLQFEIYEAAGCLLADVSGLIQTVFANKNTVEPGALALGFHLAVAGLVENMCIRLRERENCNMAALSGGVFQNDLLLALVTEKLTRAGFTVFTNNMTAPNDGTIALGQAYIGGRKTCV